LFEITQCIIVDDKNSYADKNVIRLYDRKRSRASTKIHILTEELCMPVNQRLFYLANKLSAMQQRNNGIARLSALAANMVSTVA